MKITSSPRKYLSHKYFIRFRSITNKEKDLEINDKSVVKVSFSKEGD